MASNPTGEIGYVLDVEGYSGSEPVHFAGFPGQFAPDKPVTVAALGFTDADAARARVAELGLPLREVAVEAGDATTVDLGVPRGKTEAEVGRGYVPAPGEPGAPLDDGAEYPAARGEAVPLSPVMTPIAAAPPELPVDASVAPAAVQPQPEQPADQPAPETALAETPPGEQHEGMS